MYLRCHLPPFDVIEKQVSPTFEKDRVAIIPRAFFSRYEPVCRQSTSAKKPFNFPSLVSMPTRELETDHCLPRRRPPILASESIGV